jgi:hypothetical protein
MKKYILTFLLLIALQSANAYRGIYVDNFTGILGAAPAESDLISYCTANGIDHITLFGLAYTSHPNNMGTSILTSSTLRSQLALFITSAHQNNIKVLAVVQESYTTLHADLALVNNYNSLYTSAKIDGISVESEFWHPNTSYPFTTNAGQFITDVKTQAATYNPHGMEVEIYVASASVPQYQVIAANTDRVLLTAYVLNRTPDVFFAYKEGQLDLIQNAVVLNGGSNPFEVVILYNAMPAYGTNWLYTNANWNSNGTPDMTCYDLAHGEFVSDYNTAVTNNPLRFTKLNLVGHKWFTYSYILNLQQLEENDYLINPGKYFDGNNDYMQVATSNSSSSINPLRELMLDKDFTISIMASSGTNNKEQVFFAMHVRDPQNNNAKVCGWKIGKDVNNKLFYESDIYGRVSSNISHTSIVNISITNSNGIDYINILGTVYTHSYTRGTISQSVLNNNTYDYNIYIGDDDELKYTSNTTTAYHGDIDYVRIWNREVSYSELPNYNGCGAFISGQMNGLVGQWEMGSPEIFPQDYFYTQTVYDNTSNANHAMMGSTNGYDANDPYYLAVSTFGVCSRRSQYALSFDGNQDQITLPPTDFTKDSSRTCQLYHSFKLEFNTCPAENIEAINDQRDANYDSTGTAQNQRVYYTPYLFHNSGYNTGTSKNEGVEIYYNRNGNLEFKVYDNTGTAKILEYQIPNCSPTPCKYSGVFSCEIQQTSSNDFELIISMHPNSSQGTPGNTTFVFNNVTPMFVTWLANHNWTVGKMPGSSNTLYDYNGFLDEIRMWNVTEEEIQNQTTCNNVYEELGYVGITPSLRNVKRLDYAPSELIANWRFDDQFGSSKLKNYSYIGSSLDGYLGTNNTFEQGIEPVALEGCGQVVLGTTPLRKNFINPFEQFMSKFDSLEHLQSHKLVNSTNPQQKPVTYSNYISTSPNPFNENLTFKLNIQSTKNNSYIVEVLDVMGRSVKRFTMLNNEQKIISTSDWPKGIYFVRVSGDYNGNLFPVKLIKP